MSIEYNPPNLEEDMIASKEIVKLLYNDKIADDFYRALCNNQWRKVEDFSDDDQEAQQIIQKLKNQDFWSVSWRNAGSIIADIRNKHYNANEDYLDYYCAGYEGTVSKLVEDSFKKIGWVVVCRSQNM